MTWEQFVDAAVERFDAAGIEDARANAEYLAAHAMHVDVRSAWRAKRKDRIQYKDAVLFSQQFFRRLHHEPLQYVLGEWEFFGLPMIVRPGALIPRPETEILVEEALREAAVMRPNIRIVDAGTGSGAIALALASRLPHAEVLAHDFSNEALSIARENNERLKLSNVQFKKSNVLHNNWLVDIPKSIDLLVSNPPYVSLADFEHLPPELRLFEPKEALTDGAGGLTFYEALARHAGRLLTPQGRLIVELGYDVGADVKRIIEDSKLQVLRVVRDLAGIDRVLVAARTRTNP